MNIKEIMQLRNAAVPLCAVSTADPAASIKTIIATLWPDAKANVPILQWDLARGLSGLNALGKESIGWYDPKSMQLPDVLTELGNKGNRIDGTIVFLHGMNRWLERDGVAQSIWNLRDVYEANGSTLIMLSPSFKLPAEIQSDVIQLDDPPPNAAEIEKTAVAVIKDATDGGGKVTMPTGADKDRLIKSLSGLASIFDVRQTLSLNIKRSRIDVAGCWESKIARIRATTGMEISIRNPTYADLCGCDNVKSEMLAVLNGMQKPGAIVFFDEIEKLFAGAGTDLSGVATSLVGLYLTWTTDKLVRGSLFTGIPGSGKTHSARCTAGEARVPFCKISDIKAGIVGASEDKLRGALAAVEALAGDGAIIMLASANWVDQLTPDVMARFTLGQYFYDFPDAQELLVLWEAYIKKYELPKQPIPESTGWVGREIDACCWRARQTNRTLIEVAKNICPSCIAQKAKLDTLRKQCDGRFLCSSRPGIYEYTTVKESRQNGRALRLTD